jgi:crotonobetaine/carnitine-CoA ligase
VLRERFSTSAFWDDVRRFGATATILIGTTAAFIGNLPSREDDADNPLRYVQMAPLPPDPQRWRTRFGIEVTSSYNMTEISSSIWTQGETPNGRTCGRVRDGYSCRIVDEHDQELPDGTPGELVVRAEEPWVLMAGYHRRPEATAAAWRNLWFHTGDLAVRDGDGWFYYLDRLTDSIRHRGENISSIEVEVEVNAFPGIVESAVVGVPSELGEDEVKVAVVIEDGIAFVPSDLIDFLRARLPGFMLPRYVAVVDSLPRTPTEKIRKQEIRSADLALAWDRSGDQPA